MSVQAQLKKIRHEIPANVVLVAVSKTKTREQIMEAYDAGQRDFGENYVQELVSKQKELPQDIRWHFIGHLQSNKVKQIAGFVHLIHGVDSIKLLEEINKQGVKLGRRINCLLQIFIAQEESKYGFSYEECRAFVKSDKFKTFTHINVQGLMGMATNTENQNQLIQEYTGLFSLFNELKSQFPEFNTLSCGMSSDFQVAIKAGSNMVRIGSHIFGERAYKDKS